MPNTHESSRTSAALGVVLALFLVGFLSMPSPASALNAPSSAAGSAATEASGPAVIPAPEADSQADESASSTESNGLSSNSAASADADSPGASTDDSTTSADKSTNGSADSGEPEKIDDGRCASEPAEGKPCIQVNKDGLNTTWAAEGTGGTLQLTQVKDKPELSMPASWQNQTFAAPADITRVPTKYGAREADGQGATADTDDSGRPVPSAPSAAKAAAKTLKLNAEGYVVDPSAEKPDQPINVKKTTWNFKSDGEKLTVTVVDETEDPDSKTTAKSDENGTSTNTSNGTSTASGSNDGSTTSSNQDSTSTAQSNTNSDSRADANASDTSATANGDPDGNQNATAGADTADAGDGSNSDSDSGNNANKDSGKDADSGNSEPGPVTPDPSTGNGSTEGRDQVPGSVGDDWLPGRDGDNQTPDYSDPVPRDPDSASPNEDTDLITGGNHPSPRDNNQASTSFSESLASTLSSSWPIFVLAAFGMAAVGFILFVVGRRKKRD